MDSGADRRGIFSKCQIKQMRRKAKRILLAFFIWNSHIARQVHALPRAARTWRAAASVTRPLG
jgi:hypothetical protein